MVRQKIEIKPLSVNVAWQGRRFKTQQYKGYEKVVLLMMRKNRLPDPPYHVEIEYGFSNKASDIDNPTKLILDILQKKFKFNDAQIYKLVLTKKIVKKGGEYFDFTINTL